MEMNDKHRICVSKINVTLLAVAWIGIALMLNLYEHSEAETTPVEVSLADEKGEEIIEAEEVSADEETTPSDDEKAISSDEPTQHPEEEIAHTNDEVIAASDEAMTPPRVDIVPAVLLDDIAAIPGKARVGKIKVDATYQSNAREIFPWLMARGVRILLLDKDLNLFAEVDRNGIIGQPVRGGLNGGVKRTANAEVANFTQTRLPDNTKHAVMWWPKTLWAKILNPIKAYHAHSAQITYQIQDNALAVTIHNVVTDQGTISPTETVHIR